MGDYCEGCQKATASRCKAARCFPVLQIAQGHPPPDEKKGKKDEKEAPGILRHEASPGYELRLGCHSTLLGESA